MSFKSVVLKITDHHFKNESLINQRNSMNLSEYCKLFPENAYLCASDAVHMENEYTNWTKPFCHRTVGGYETRNMIASLFIIIIVCVSLFGNSILCQIVFFAKVKAPTNILIGNISIANILITVINIPIQYISLVLDNWPFGSILCKSLRFIQELSVATSSFTMAFIALDRYYLIAYPLKAKATLSTTIKKLIFIWCLAIVISLPYIFMAQIQKSDSCQKYIRCTVIYPETKFKKRFFTLYEFFLTYIIPLSLTSIMYVRMCAIIKKRNIVGSVTQNQIIHHKAAKLKTIKLLVAVLATFAFCWLPINIYHIYADFTNLSIKKHMTHVYMACHMIAVSSVCYNPFIYFWMNKKYKKKVKSHIKRMLQIKECGQFLRTSFIRLYSYKTMGRQSDSASNYETGSMDYKITPIIMTKSQKEGEITEEEIKDTVFLENYSKE